MFSANILQKSMWWPARPALWQIACLAFATSIGCQGAPEGPLLVPVSGSVTLNGVPLEGAQVAFHPQGMTPGAGGFGGTDVHGKFVIGNQSASGFVAGAPAGEYKVTVSKQKVAPIPRLRSTVPSRRPRWWMESKHDHRGLVILP